MNTAFALIDLAGSIALLLWGVHMVCTGIERTFGADLRRLLGIALGNRMKAFVAGAGVTALLQSSTATGLIIASYTASGLVGLVPALGGMLGANVGTTLIVQVLAFDVSRFASALLLVGVLMFRRGTATRMRDLGRAAIGLGLILFALHQLLSLVEPYEQLPILRDVLHALSDQPVLAVILAAGLTWAAHSSVAIVLLIMSLAANGTIPTETALALVLGANLGTAINPILEGDSNPDPAAKRLPIGNLTSRVIGCLVVLGGLHWIVPAIRALDPDPARAVANFHTAFNLAIAIFFLPFLGPFARLLTRLLPARAPVADPFRPMHLDPAARAVPAMAISGAAREALRMVDILDTMLDGALRALDNGDRHLMTEVTRLDDALDGLNAAIKDHLISLDVEQMRQEDQRRTFQILTFVINLAQAGDLVDHGVVSAATKMRKRGLAFSPQGRADLLVMLARLRANLRSAAAVFMMQDSETARLLACEKETFRQIEEHSIESHFDRLRAGRVDTIETSSFHLDVTRDLKQINAHLIAAAAYPVLKMRGELLPSRLRQI